MLALRTAGFHGSKQGAASARGRRARRRRRPQLEPLRRVGLSMPRSWLVRTRPRSCKDDKSEIPAHPAAAGKPMAREARPLTPARGASQTGGAGRDQHRQPNTRRRARSASGRWPRRGTGRSHARRAETVSRGAIETLDAGSGDPKASGFGPFRGKFEGSGGNLAQDSRREGVGQRPTTSGPAANRAAAAVSAGAPSGLKDGRSRQEGENVEQQVAQGRGAPRRATRRIDRRPAVAQWEDEQHGKAARSRASEPSA
jgi:hypothetical protein